MGTKKVEKTPEQVVKDLLAKRFGDEKVDSWKKQFAPRKIAVIAVEDKVAVLKPITASEIGQYSMMMADAENGGLDVASRYILNALWLDGDDCLRDDEEYFMSAMLQVQNTIEVKKSLFIRL